MWMHRIPWPVQFVGLAIVWGCSFWWMALGLRALQPAQVAAGRLILGAAVLLAVCAFGRIPLPTERRTWLHLAVVAALLNSVPFTLFAFGQQRVTSILAGVVNACTPLAVLAVTLVAFPYARRYLSPLGLNPVSLAASQVSLGALLLVPLLVASTIDQPIAVDALSADVVWGMLALGVLGSGLAYVLNFGIIDAAGSSTASSVTYLTPIVAVAAGRRSSARRSRGTTSSAGRSSSLGSR